jgi:hypothetical protein
MRCRIGWWLRRLADRIDPCHTPRSPGISFTYERGRGVVFHGPGGDWPPRGCPLWYLSEADHERVYTESDTYKNVEAR